MKTANLNKIVNGLAVAGILGGFCSQASAAPTCPESLDPAASYKCVFFDVGASHGGDANSKTSAFYELGYNSTLATSIYKAGLPNNSAILDTNIKTILNYYGLTGGPTNYTTVDLLHTQALKDTPQNPGERNIDTLSGPNPRDTERFDAQNDNGGIGWGLTYNYVFNGTLNLATGPSYNGGYLDFFFNDWVTNTSEQVLRINITGSQLNLANLNILGTVSYDWTGAATDIYGLNSIGDGTNDCVTALCQKFWNFQSTTPTDFYSLEGSGVSINMKLDTNVNPPIPDGTQLVPFTGADGNTYWIRQSTLDGSLRFNVPEPGSLALMGLGLAGIGRVLRKKNYA